MEVGVWVGKMKRQCDALSVSQSRGTWPFLEGLSILVALPWPSASLVSLQPQRSTGCTHSHLALSLGSSKRGLGHQ